MPRSLLVLLLLLVPVLAGCVTPPAVDPSNAADAEWVRCEHPWPCGDGSEWPVDLVGPFEVAALEDLAIPTSAGVLDGWVVLPDVPDGTRVPVVVEATPYKGQCTFHNAPRVSCSYHANTPLWTGQSAPYTADFGFRPLVEAGFAFASVNIPGTGASDGCFDDYGPGTQRALAEFVDALGAEPWSNGRVGMIGLSASGTTPFAAAVENPQALKTIVPGGVQTNLYTFSATPQGALAAEGFFHTRYAASVSWGPPVGGDPADVPGLPARALERACPDVATYAAQNQRGVTGDRDLAFWESRMLALRFPDVTTSVLVFHGFDDAFGSGHAFQEDDAWGALTNAPKRVLFGQWGHEYPDGDHLADYPGGEDWWADVAIPWFDFWLKGVGDPPRLGVADWEDSTGAWHASAAWPPGEAVDEAFFLVDGALAAAPGDGATTFNAGRQPESDLRYLCDALLPGTPGGAGFTTAPATARAVLAGNPFLHLLLESDGPSGLVEATLYDLAPDFACENGEPAGEATWLSSGAADLQYHAGNLAAEDFPVDTVQDVRVDFWNLAHVVEPGHRVAVVLSGPGSSNTEQVAFPTLSVHGESRLVLPFAEGTLGGVPDDGSAPPKPFLPS